MYWAHKKSVKSRENPNNPNHGLTLTFESLIQKINGCSRQDALAKLTEKDVGLSWFNRASTPQPLATQQDEGCVSPLREAHVLKGGICTEKYPVKAALPKPSASANTMRTKKGIVTDKKNWAPRVSKKKKKRKRRRQELCSWCLPSTTLLDLTI